MGLQRPVFGLDRAVIGAIAAGGMTMGLVAAGVGLFSGVASALIVGSVAIGVGVSGAVGFARRSTRSLAFLTAVPLLIALLSPLVAWDLALALDSILVAVLGTGMLLAHDRRQMWGFVIVVLTSAAADPLLLALGVPDASVAVPAGPIVTTAIVATSLVALVIVYRELRGILIHREEHHREMNHFISAVAHNLRTPLTAVLGFGSILSEEIHEEPLAEFAHVVWHRAWEISDGIDDLLVIARSGTSSLEVVHRPVALRPVVDRVLAELPGADAKIAYSDIHGVALGDPARIRQIVRHLIANAATHGGPHISISTRQAGPRVTLRIHDDGDPIDPDVLDRYFEPFQTGSVSLGTPTRGIGLTVARLLARHMRGDVTLTSRQDGTTAELTLPVDTSIPDPTRTAILPRRKQTQLNPLGLPGHSSPHSPGPVS